MRSVWILAVLASGVVAAADARAGMLADAPCQVTSSERSELASQAPGVLAEILVDRGDHVQKGQVVARLHREVEQAQLVLAQARAGADSGLRVRRVKLALAERTLARNQDLLAKKFISEQDIDQLRSDREIAALDVATAVEALTQARAELQAAQAALAIREIRSPIDGVVTERGLNPGERVGEKPVMVIERLDRLYADVALPSSLLPQVRAGTRATLSFNLPGLPPRNAEAALVDPAVDAKSDMFSVRFVLNNADLRVPAGIKCRIDLEGVP
jgi:RND family efflux transporter MFP subunit